MCGDDDRLPATRSVSTDPVHRGAQGARMGPLRRPELVGCDRGLKIGQRVDRNPRDDDRHRDPGGRGAHPHPRPGQQPGTEAQPNRRVMVAGRDDDLRAGVDDPGQRVVEEGRRLRRWHRPVVDVAGQQDRVDPLGADHLDELVEDELVRTLQGDPVEPSAQVPVGGVQQPHTRRL